MNELERWARHTTELWQRRLDRLDAVLKTEKNKSKKYGKH
jgi:hypothetical protein